jgi:hypothetical protein
MNNPIPLEYLTSFSQTRQAMMQQFATGLTHGVGSTKFPEIEPAPGRYVKERAT